MSYVSVSHSSQGYVPVSRHQSTGLSSTSSSDFPSMAPDEIESQLQSSFGNSGQYADPFGNNFNPTNNAPNQQTTTREQSADNSHNRHERGHKALSFFFNFWRFITHFYSQFDPLFNSVNYGDSEALDTIFGTAI